MQLVSNYGLRTSQFSYSKQQFHHICGSQLEANRQTGFWPVAAENTSGEFNKYFICPRILVQFLFPRVKEIDLWL